jgi:hypothetical protein
MMHHAPLLFGNKSLFTWIGPYAWPDFFYVFFIVIIPNLGQGLRMSHELGGLTKKKIPFPFFFYNKRSK